MIQSVSYGKANDSDPHIGAVRAAIDRRDPLVVVTGKSGSGKTALCRAVANDPAVAASVVIDPFLTFHDLLKQVAGDLGATADAPAGDGDFDLAVAATEHDLLLQIEHRLAALGDTAALVVIDDAHLLNPLVLGRVRALLNLSAGSRGLTVLLAGQPALETTLKRPEFESVNQRVALRCRLDAPPAAAAAPDSAARASRVNPVRVGAAAAVLAGVFAVGWLIGVASQGALLQVARTTSAALRPARTAPASAASATTGTVPSAEDERAKLIDGELAMLRRRTVKRALDFADAGDVDQLIALRDEAEKACLGLGAARPDCIGSVLADLDDVVDHAREVRLKLDARAFRR